MRIDGNTMTAKPGAWIERHESEWLRGGGFDDFPRVNVQSSAQASNFIDQTDVDRPKCIFQKLRGLCDSSGRHWMHATDYFAVGVCCNLGAQRSHSADYLWNIAGIKLMVAGIDSFRRESQQKVFIDSESGLFQHWQNYF